MLSTKTGFSPSQGHEQASADDIVAQADVAREGRSGSFGRRLVAWLPGVSAARPPRAPVITETRQREMDDTALLLRVAEGDATAFELLYDRFSPSLFALVIRIVGTRTEAEDVIQDGLETVWRRAGDFDPALGSAFAWSATIVRHKAIDALRSKCRHLERLQSAFSGRGEDVVVDAADGRAEIMEQRQAVRAALLHLTDTESRAIELAFFDGLTHQEIADGLGVPLGTVKARIRRGMMKLRPALANLS